MASSVFRRDFWMSAGIFISKMIKGANSCSGCTLGGPPMKSTISSGESLPWLMLPPDDDMVYKFYSLAEKKLLSIKKSGRGGEESPDDDAEVVGSSHGWLALLNRRNNDLFLSNPLSGRHIELPEIDGLTSKSKKDRRILSKVILSSSPDNDDCRAMMIFGRANRMTLCTPGDSVDWTRIGDPYFDYELGNPRHLCARVYEDLVYCTNWKVMTCMTPFELELVFFTDRDGNFCSEIEDWDIFNASMDEYVIQSKPPQSMNKLRLHHENKIGENMRSWVEENVDLLQHQCVQIPHLVYAEQLNRLYIVMRFVVLMGDDGTPLDRVPHCTIRGLRGFYSCQTVGFIVLEVHPNGTYEVVDDLNGLVMFVGINHSLAISASELEPNSIYFTDAKRIKMLDGRHDTGVFNYINKTISPITIQGEKIKSSLAWFTPSPT